MKLWPRKEAEKEIQALDLRLAVVPRAGESNIVNNPQQFRTNGNIAKVVSVLGSAQSAQSALRCALVVTGF
jgi:hypothetical protein